MKTTATVYLICGFIGAGKTTFAKKLALETGAVRITKDEWSIRLIGNDPTIEGYAEHDHRIIELSRDVAFQLAGNGIDVILDEGFWEKDQRNQLRQRIENLGATAVIYYLDTPVDLIRERMVERNRTLTTDSFTISRELFDHYLQYWQPLDDDEDYILVHEMT
ncbi:MAG: AAA family ATPase [Thermomicrobiales bacterium]